MNTERRLILFFALAMIILVANTMLQRAIAPPKPASPRNEQTTKVESKDKAPAKKSTAEAATVKPALAESKVAKPSVVESEKPLPEQWVSLGSADPGSKNPYRMLVTLTNRGAAVVRTELSSPRYRDIEDRSGYLGHLFMRYQELVSPCKVDVVGFGTPAYEAGLRAGDVIQKINNTAITDQVSLRDYLSKRTKPGQKVTLAIVRAGKEMSLPVTLRRRPLEVLKPENADPLSFQMTLARVDDQKLSLDDTVVDNAKELSGVTLRTGTWVVAESDQEHVVFRREIQSSGLEITKTYRLEKVPEKSLDDRNYKAYHLVFDVAIRNTGNQKRKVAYQLDGPTGLPIEGYWYAYKIWTSGTVGLRDVVVSYNKQFPTLVSCQSIAADPPKIPEPWNKPDSLSFIGVDAQYFSSEIIPQPEMPDEIWVAQSQAMRAGDINPDWRNKTNTTSRLVSVDYDLSPNKEVKHRYLLFTGPKRPDLLAQYGMEDLVYYGWFWWAAKPMVQILHFFYGIVGNWGLAIVMLTALVRLLMFPLSRKQALSTQKMAQLQPEIKKLQEKHKNKPEEKMRAQQELFRKHNYNPLSGCLVAFIQIPIFFALYKSLGIDVELRQAPLISESIRWCSNLAAPDMLFNWSGWMPEFITNRPGIFGLGHYFNILPLLTIVLFLWQQKKMMPPPADEQAAMQQNMMKYMMIFMGLMFFKVASGLCIYYIVSSLWAMGERKFLPKLVHPHEAGELKVTTAAVRPTDAARNKKNRPR